MTIHTPSMLTFSKSHVLINQRGCHISGYFLLCRPLFPLTSHDKIFLTCEMHFTIQENFVIWSFCVSQSILLTCFSCPNIKRNSRLVGDSLETIIIIIILNSFSQRKHVRMYYMEGLGCLEGSVNNKSITTSFNQSMYLNTYVHSYI